MPLFIDLHIDDGLTLDLVKQFHMADKALQDKYGVKYLQILINQPQGYLFCLVEGPDKESCARVHQETHGNIACNILEITESDFGALIANKSKDGKDFTLNQDGTLDTGNRAILALSLLGTPENYQLAKVIVNEVIHQAGGRNGESFGNRLVAIFDSPSSAVDSGIIIQQRIADSAIPVEVRMGADVGPPLGEKGIFFEEVHRSADRFSFISMSGQITVSTKIRQLYNGNMNVLAHPVKVIGLPDEKFLGRVMDCTEKIWDKNDMTITDFARELGMSKSQLVRKLKSLTSLSPNDFLKEFRLRKAIHMIEDRTMNIAEITMAIGFSNPSYFTKCFRRRFGKAPSDYLDFQEK